MGSSMSGGIADGVGQEVDKGGEDFGAVVRFGGVFGTSVQVMASTMSVGV